MIIGIGTDIIEVARIERAVSKNKNFLKKIFTEREIAYFASKNNQVTSIAGTFAAKEAVSKVFGTGIRDFKWTDIEIWRDDLGKPNVTLYEGAKVIATQLNIAEIIVTISHCELYAVAYCIGVNQPSKGEKI